MSLSNYRLKIQQGSTIYTCDLYTTPEEARSVTFVDHPRVCVNIGGTTYYCGTCGDNSSDLVREGSPIAVFYDSTIPRTYHIAQKAFFNIGITASANQTITVTASNKPLGESGTGSFSFTSGTKYFPYGTTWTASVSPSTGWNAGALTPGSSGTLTNDNVKVTAGAASLKTFVLTLAATTHQTIKIQYQPRNADGTMGSWTSDIASGSSAKTYTLRYGSKYKITSFAASTGWNAGTLKNGSTNVTASTSTTYTFTGAITISATAATHKTFTLKATSEAHQTLTVKYKNYNGTSFATEKQLAEGASATVGYGTTWTASVKADAGYTAGALSPGSKGTVTANTTISVSDAKPITPVITFNLNLSNVSCKVTYTNTSGQSKTETITGIKTIKYTIKYNTTVKIECPDNSSLESAYVTIKKGSDTQTTLYEGSSWTSGKHTANTTYSLVGEGINT